MWTKTYKTSPHTGGSLLEDPAGGTSSQRAKSIGVLFCPRSKYNAMSVRVFFRFALFVAAKQGRHTIQQAINQRFRTNVLGDESMT